MNKVEALFQAKGIPRSGTFVYPKQVAIDFVNECRKFNIRILGIDALIIRGEYTQPSMDNSIDFTASSQKSGIPENIWDTAANFLEKRDDKYYFEIVCG